MTPIIYQTPDGHWHQASADGSSVSGMNRIILPDGEVLSMQPQGAYGTRPAGTDGPWEQAKAQPGFYVYTTAAEGGGTESFPVPVLLR